MALHIAHVVPFADRLGGYERQAKLLAESQIEAGDEVTLITHLENAGNPTWPLTSNTGKPEVVRVSGVGVRFRRFDRRAIRRALVGADIVHVHALDPLAGCVVAQAGRRRIPTIVKIATLGDVAQFAAPESTPPGPDSTHDGRSQWLPVERRMLTRAWSRLRRADRFIALNSAIRDELLQSGIRNDRVMLLPNAVRIPQEPAPFRPDGLQALYLGRIEPRKRVGDIIKAHSIVRRQISEASLELVGDGSQREALARLAGEAVKFTGAASDPRDAYRRADLFVFASELEWCPNSLLEAAALGLGGIATRIPAIIDWFKDGRDVILVDPTHPEQIADAWINLLRDPRRRRALGRAARDTVRRRAELGLIRRTISGVYAQLLQRGEQVVKSR